MIKKMVVYLDHEKFYIIIKTENKLFKVTFFMQKKTLVVNVCYFLFIFYIHS